MNELAPNPIRVPIKCLHPEAVIPTRASDGDAGWDLYALEAGELEPGQRELFRTGIALAIPHGYVGYIKPRSGLALRQGINVLGGVIDSGYRGDVGVILHNTDIEIGTMIDGGDRIAQLVIQPVPPVYLEEVYVLPDSERGAGGFGSTGA